MRKKTIHAKKDAQNTNPIYFKRPVKILKVESIITNAANEFINKKFTLPLQ